MDLRLETFILYYLCWHEGELSFSEFRQSLIDDLRPEGMKAALEMFREMRLEREKSGDRRTYFEAQRS
jgi:hypothetical protein